MIMVMIERHKIIICSLDASPNYFLICCCKTAGNPFKGLHDDDVRCCCEKKLRKRRRWIFLVGNEKSACESVTIIIYFVNE